MTPAALCCIALSFFGGCIHLRLMEDIDAPETSLRNEARDHERLGQEHMRDSERETNRGRKIVRDVVEART